MNTKDIKNKAIDNYSNHLKTEQEKRSGRDRELRKQEEEKFAESKEIVEFAIEQYIPKEIQPYARRGVFYPHGYRRFCIEFPGAMIIHAEVIRGKENSIHGISFNIEESYKRKGHITNWKKTASDDIYAIIGEAILMRQAYNRKWFSRLKEDMRYRLKRFLLFRAYLKFIEWVDS